MSYDDFEYRKRLFNRAFLCLSEARNADDESRKRLWSITQYCAGIIEEDELRQLYPDEADDCISHLQSQMGNALQPSITKSWQFEIDLLADRETLQNEISIAKKQFEFFCNQVMVAREKLGAIELQNGTKLDDFTDYPVKPFRGKQKRQFEPFDEWRRCLVAWWKHHIEGISARQLAIYHFQDLYGYEREDIHKQKTISALLEEAERLINSASKNTFPT